MNGWTQETPTEPGWYFLNMTGCKTGVRRTDVVELRMPPKDNLVARFGELCFAQWEKSYGGRYFYHELRIDEDCAPVWWKRIEDPGVPG